MTNERQEARDAMTQQGLSARRLASRSGLTLGAVLDYLNGKRNSHSSTAKLIRLALGLESTEGRAA